MVKVQRGSRASIAASTEKRKRPHDSNGGQRLNADTPVGRRAAASRTGAAHLPLGRFVEQLCVCYSQQATSLLVIVAETEMILTLAENASGRWTSNGQPSTRFRAFCGQAVHSIDSVLKDF